MDEIAAPTTTIVNSPLCPSCQYKIQPDWFFCPNCAHELREKPPVISIFKQFWIYFVSFFFSPLGLVWGFKYVKYKDPKTKMIGIIAIVLNLIAIIILFYSLKKFTEQYSNILNNLVPSY